MLTVLYNPFPTLDAARAACAALLSARAVGCCNLLPAVESHYLWHGVPTQATETILIAKTTPEMADRARAILAAHHPHECPAILSFNADANPAFAAWVGTCVTLTKNTDKGD